MNPVTVTSERLTVTFAVATSDGATRWSIAASVKPGGQSAGRRLALAIEAVAGSAARWSWTTPHDWSCTGLGWTERHQAIIDLAAELARFGAEGWGDA